jgi:hypothetical protein
VRYAIEIDSGVMTYIPSFIRIGSGMQNLIGGSQQTDSMRRRGSHIF